QGGATYGIGGDPAGTNVLLCLDDDARAFEQRQIAGPSRPKQGSPDQRVDGVALDCIGCGDVGEAGGEPPDGDAGIGCVALALGVSGHEGLPEEQPGLPLPEGLPVEE